MMLNLKNNQNAKDVVATLVTQFWRLVSGPIMMLLIPLYLSEEQQGYWFLFVSLSALSIFADLGFSNIILQFSAHEFAFLYFTEKGLLEGDTKHLNRLASFFKFILNWIIAISAVVFPIIYTIGIVYLRKDGVLSKYIVPWTIYAFGSLLNFFTASILSFIEGLNKIEAVQKIRLRVAVLNTSIVAVILFFSGNVYALAFGMLLSTSTVFISLFGIFRKMLAQLMNISKYYSYPWRKEVMPLFMKYALSFSSGYFIFQIYTPLMHYFHGPTYSGKVGISLTLVTAIFGLSNVWMYTITPKLNMLVSTKNWQELEALFIKRLLFSITTYIVIGLCTVLFLLLFGWFWIIPKITSRFLPTSSIFMLYIGYFLQVPVNAWALYLRGHKQEPYMVISIISAVWIFITTFMIGKFFAPTYFFCGFLSMQMVGILVAYFIFKNCKRQWHSENMR